MKLIVMLILSFIALAMCKTRGWLDWSWLQVAMPLMVLATLTLLAVFDYVAGKRKKKAKPVSRADVSIDLGHFLKEAEDKLCIGERQRVQLRDNFWRK